MIGVEAGTGTGAGAEAEETASVGEEAGGPISEAGTGTGARAGTAARLETGEREPASVEVVAGSGEAQELLDMLEGVATGGGVLLLEVVGMT